MQIQTFQYGCNILPNILQHHCNIYGGKRMIQDRDAQLFYYKTKTGKEIDFLFKERGNIQLIQVSADISDKNTLHREKRALIEAAKEIGIKEGMIINGNIKDSIVENGTRISIVPIWEFLILNPRPG